MRVTARLSYGLNALVDLANADGPVKGDALALRHDISLGFVEKILGELRRAGLVDSKRGGHGGYWLARPSHTITVADVLHALGGADPIQTSVVSGHLDPVWATLAQAHIAAAQSITLAALGSDRHEARPAITQATSPPS